MTIWMQPMCTHNLTQAHNLGNYSWSIQSQISLASKLHATGKRGTLVWIAGAVLLGKALFCLKCIFNKTTSNLTYDDTTSKHQKQ